MNSPLATKACPYKFTTKQKRLIRHAGRHRMARAMTASAGFDGVISGLVYIDTAVRMIDQDSRSAFPAPVVASVVIRT